ncbi:hypothetical protein Pan153_50220 [Gimesia panareensis]|uniref:Uncharacterized protein n=1 Tax=Gimesia panareensis TaxID=2527978 RepID=A0A518FVH2_9PLAN|nr:hypothetical protein [Gimesia panareensis]QDV20347.1 hypothetical protein Pan153_50220 [Gimesia panareensis]
MLPGIKPAGVCVLMIVSISLLQGAEEPASVKNGWAAQPQGKYEFLQAPYAADEEAAIRQSLPFRRIKLQRFGQPDILHGGRAVNEYVEFHANGKALLHAISGSNRDGVYTGTIDLRNYARLCLLYEALIQEAGTPEKFGHEIQSSHPVISELTLTFTGSQPDRIHRNDFNFGDFKFWVFENVFGNLESRVKWEKVEE